jgi:hypothetical protein
MMAKIVNSTESMGDAGSPGGPNLAPLQKGDPGADLAKIPSFPGGYRKGSDFFAPSPDDFTDLAGNGNRNEGQKLIG